MGNLYYATLERGFGDIIKDFIIKQDKRSGIKKLYDTSVLFFGDESFKTSNLIFKDIFMCLDSSKKAGAGALNFEMKHILERKDLKINFPQSTQSFKLSILAENKNTQVDPALKKALETTLRKITKKNISYMSTNAELVLLAKEDGENLFLKRIFVENNIAQNLKSGEVSLGTAFAMCFLSEPVSSEVALDPFAGSGTIASVRANFFKKANVIANSKSKEEIAGLKKLAKLNKEKPFSVMNYDFLSPTFPIHFVDKVITILPVYDFGEFETASEFYTKFFEKLYVLKIKIAVLLVPKGLSISKYIGGKFDEVASFSSSRYAIKKLKITL